MNTLSKKCLILSVSTFIFVPKHSFAEDLFTEQWGLGVNAIRSSIYTEQKNKNIVLLHLEYRGESLNIDSNSISYSIYNNEQYNLEILAKTLYYGYEHDDSPILKGMGERQSSLEVGGRASLKTDYGLLSLHVLSDVLGNHKGQEIEIRFGEPFYTEKWNGGPELTVGLSGGFRWQSKDVVDYYYGVKNSEATPNRKKHQGNSALIPFFGVEVKTRIAKHFSLKGGLMYEHLPSTITQSPLTSSSDIELRTHLGLSYWF